MTDIGSANSLSPCGQHKLETSRKLRARTLLYAAFSRLLEWISAALRPALKGRAPTLASVAAVVKADARLLLIERSDGRGLDLPGGIVRWGETASQALYREVHEETGLYIEVEHCIGVFSEPTRDPRFGCICVAYACHVVSGKLRASEEGTPLWVSVQKLPASLAFGNHAILEKCLVNEETGKRDPA